MAGGRAQGFTTALTDIDTTAQEYPGMIRMDYNADYKYVQFTGTTAVAIGDVVCYVLANVPTTETPEGFSPITVVDGANTGLGAGVAVAAHASGSVTYGWIQIRGAALLSTAFGGTTAVGAAVTTVGAAAPGVTVALAGNSIVGRISNIANRVMSCDFPN